MKLFVIIGAIFGFLAVALGAFGAHVLENRIPAHYVDIWEKAVKYQMFHAVGILFIGLLAEKTSGPLINWSGWLMTAGILLFSGSLYVLSVTQIKMLGAITPIGGVSFLAAWVLMIIAVYKH